MVQIDCQNSPLLVAVCLLLLLEANSRVVCLFTQDYYPMFRSARGRAVIINNKYFLHSDVRRGSEEDVADLQRLFDALHYKVDLQENKTAQVTSVITHARTHTHPFNGPFFGTTRVGSYQKGKTNLDFTEARDNEWQWHQLGYVQVCTSLQTDNHASTPPLSFLQTGCPSCRPTNSVKALKAQSHCIDYRPRNDRNTEFVHP